MEVYTDCSSHSGDTVGHRAKRMGASRGRSEKNAIRVCGDWSEQLSSKGKIYFYNCITEVSQWQKPPEWKLPDMDHEELVRRLRARDQLDTRNLKRSRVVGTTHTNNLKDSEGEQRSSSPKRPKYLNELRTRNPIQDRKLSPATQSEISIDRNNCVNAAMVTKVCSQRRSSSRNSPRKIYERSYGDCHYQAQSRKDVGASGPRLAPTDDMDISPNSSPMSGGSSPTHPSYHVQSIASRRIRSGVHHPVPPERTTYGSHRMNIPSQADAITQSNKSGPLRQLVDVIRASIGGLLGDSPSSGGSKNVPENYSTTNGAQTCDRSKLSYSNTCPSKDAKYRSPSFMTHASCVRTQTNPSPESSISLPYKIHPDKTLSCDPSSRAGLSNSNSRNISDAHRSQTGDNQTKNISGLVSTLTTLVSLISNTRCSHPSSTSPGVTSVAAPGVTQAGYQRTPTHHSTSQRVKQHTSSPAIPSPLTPSANTGTSSSGGSSSNRMTHSMLTSSAYNLSSHQMDDLLSSLENLTQQARSGSSKLLTECYQVAGQRMLSDYGGPPDDQMMQTTHGLVSPHTGHFDHWSRTRERCDSTTNVSSTTAKVPHRSLNQTHQADRLNDLVKVLKSAVQQHLNSRSPVSSNHDHSNPVLHHPPAPPRAHEVAPLPTDITQNNRGEPKSIIASPSSSSHPSVFNDSHLKSQANDLVSDGSGSGSVHSSRFVTTGASPCVTEGGVSIHSHSNVSSTASVPEASGYASTSTSHIPINSANASCVSAGRLTDQHTISSSEQLIEDDSINRVNRFLNCPETQQFLDPVVASKYVDKAVERLEQEAQVEARKFDRLQSVLYGELSAESKKLRALVRISEAKLAIHKEKQSALQELMDAIETRRHLPSLSFSDDV